VDRALTAVDDGSARASALMVAQGDLLCAARGAGQGVEELVTRTRVVGALSFVERVEEQPVGVGLERLCVGLHWRERGKERDVWVSTWQVVSAGRVGANAASPRLRATQRALAVASH
ncbi:MAG: hypothetical protein OWT27_07145, partial [Firmicutes bacterium]|nr:hypothetical protein [Bacillota bacterium]